MSATDSKDGKISNQLHDRRNSKVYTCKRFLGKGGFAKCYEIVDVATKNVHACKIVSKNLMVNKDLKQKFTQEISIHRSLSHPNVVKFHSVFEDSLNVYIVLELCQKRSMLELHKRRKNITEYECRYYMYQIIQGVKYLHDHRIIHRDLKLGNLLLDDNLHVKIGDFGLATRVEYDGDRKRTMCGTPNYMAPEILNKLGHSFEVDIWSMGCIMYTLLVGRPPFKTNTVEETYSKIKKCEYHVPIYMRKFAANMIVAMLHLNPERRPTINDLLKFDFFTQTAVPLCLPVSCLAITPRLDAKEITQASVPLHFKSLTEANGLKDEICMESSFLKKNLHDSVTASAQACRNNECTIDIQILHDQLEELINGKPKLQSNDLTVENTDPAAQPLFWISKWVDYSHKYGFGYQLCDEGIGVMFNDATRLILLPNQINVHYIDKEGQETYMTTTDYSTPFDKKMKLLSFFKHYMTEHLVKTGANNVSETDQISRMPYLHSWFRTKCAVVMHLTNGSVQFNFADHKKIVLCPRMSAITYMDEEKSFFTYRFTTIQKYGCSKDLYEKIHYAKEKIGKMLQEMMH